MQLKNDFYKSNLFRFYQAFLDYIVKFYLNTEAGSCYWLVIICKRKGDVNINIENECFESRHGQMAIVVIN